MSTTKIMLIRHGEKPNGDPGLMPDGSQSVDALTATGWERAKRPVAFFDPGAAPIARPQHLFASGPSAAEKSLRPIQTITPLSEKLGLAIDTTCAKGEEEGLVAKAKAVGDVVLIAWQHEMIPKIADLTLGVGQQVPPRWPGHRFDLVWVFDRQAGDDAWSFSQIPQLLMPGDSRHPIALDD